MTENEMVGWHHQLNGHEFEQTLGDSEGQGNLACIAKSGIWLNDLTARSKSPTVKCTCEGISHQSQLQCMKCLACVCVCFILENH